MYEFGITGVLHKYSPNAFVVLYLKNYFMSVQYVKTKQKTVEIIIYPCKQWRALNSLHSKIK